MKTSDKILELIDDAVFLAFIPFALAERAIRAVAKAIRQ